MQQVQIKNLTREDFEKVQNNSAREICKKWQRIRELEANSAAKTDLYRYTANTEL